MKNSDGKIGYSHPCRSKTSTSVCEGMCEPRGCPAPRSRRAGGSSDTMLANVTIRRCAPVCSWLRHSLLV